ncbi:MAG: NAD+ synthase [Armatimonadota bacterium]|nr:NAD+ synthase [Armatimonadota bacterium]
MKHMRVALAQINLTVGDLDGNTQRICQAVEEARTAGADVVVFPELAITGYPPEDLLLRPKFIEENLSCLHKVAASSQGIVVIVGFVDRQETLFNASAVLADGRIAGVYHKRLLPNYGVFDEKRYFAPGKSCPLFHLDDVPFGVSICEDIWFPDGPHLALSRAGALVLFNLNASPYHMGKWRLREEMLATRARDGGVAVVYVNLVGGQDELVFDGGSVVFDHEGSLLARGPQFEEALVIADLPIEAIRRRRARTPTIAEEGRLPLGEVPTPSIPVRVTFSTRKQQVNPTFADPLPPLEEVYRALVLGTSDYVRKNGFTTVVVGLSGGIDSSLTAVIAADALGPENVVGVFMPSPYTSQESARYAQELARRLGIRFLLLPIGPIFQAFLQVLEEPFSGLPRDVTEENIQARIRGTLLMALSNKFGWLVLATGNKSEMSTGYATLYGDMAGGFAVLKDVPKTLVYALARHRNERDPVIPEGVLERPPTAELRPGQVDQETLPPYEILDPLLKAYVEEDKPPEEIVAAGFDPDVVAKVTAMVDRNEYKRRQAPPGIKITPRALGKDRRLPITNRYRPFLADSALPREENRRGK